jgi:hypothetical protein
VIEPAGLTYIMGYLGLPPVDPDFDTALREIPIRMGKRFPNVPVETWATYIRRVWHVAEDGRLSLRYDLKLRDATLDQMKAAEGQPAPDLWPLFAALDGLPLALIRGANSDLLSHRYGGENARNASRHDLFRRGRPGPCAVSR